MNHEDNKQTAAGHQMSAGKYMIGFVLAVVLTVISFGLVVTDILPKTAVLIGLVVAAVAQILVHLYYFLHLNRSPEARWNLISIAFTALILFIFIAGTVWVMITLNSRMM